MSCMYSGLVFFFKGQYLNLDVFPFSVVAFLDGGEAFCLDSSPIYFYKPNMKCNRISASVCSHPAYGARPLTAPSSLAVGEVGRNPGAGRDCGAGRRRAESRRQTVFTTDAGRCRRHRPFPPTAITGTPPAASATGTHTHFFLLFSLASLVYIPLSQQLYIYGKLLA